ncbi:MAG: amino acid ABC transporter substrate-binding protein [Dehalococcoidia bacterium]
MKISNQLCSVWVLAVACLALTACGASEETLSSQEEEASDPTEEPNNSDVTDSDTETAPSGEPIKIGAHLPLSGQLASNGERVRDGYEFAVKAINEEGGIDGRPLDLIVADDAGDATTATNVVRELISGESVTAVLGTYGSGAGLAGSAMAEQMETPNIQPFASSPEMVTRGFEYLVNTYALASQTQTLFAEMLIDLVEPETAAIMYIDNPFAIAGRDAIVAALESTDIEVVLDERVPTGEGDYSSVISQMVSLDPDVVVTIVYFPDHIAFMEQARQFNLEPELLYTDGSIPWQPPVLEALGTNADTTMGAADWFPGAEIEGSDAILEEYVSATGTEVSVEFVKGYQAVQILADALRRAGPDPSNESLRDALAETEMDTIAGKVAVGPDGQLEGNYTIVQLQDMTHQAVWPLDRASADPVPFKAWADR